MNIRELKRESKGITLISLIIVIIILLILTAIVVMASYNNGVINKADESSDQYDIGKEKEYLKLTFTHFQMNYMEKGLGFTNQEYEKELKQYSENVKVDNASEEDIGKGIEIDFKESFGGYMKVTFNVTNNSYVVARIKAKDSTTPDIPDIPETQKYIITYDANGGENAPRFQEKTEKVSLKLSPQKPTRRGYTFIGWSTRKEPLAATYQPGGDFDLDRETTLYAVWQINTYTITYNLDGGTLLSQNPDSYTVETDTITLNNPSKDGYMFLGWTGSNGVTPQRTVKIEKGSTESKEYTAVYGEGNYKVNGTYYIDLEEAINACENNAETTIEVLKNCDDLFENNNIENKNIILNLGNNTLNLSKTINVKSGSSLKIIGEGKIQNQSDVAISVEGTLIIGENDTTVGKTPIIEGTTFGISTPSGNLYFYDGQIIGNKAVNGEITKIPESYTALSKTENSKEVVSLDIVADAVARIGYKYFTTLQAAVDAVQSGIDNQVEIIMVDNATVSSAVTISEIQNIKLNLDGHTVQASGNTYVLDNSGKLEIVDTSSAQTGTIDNSAYRAIKNQKELTLTNGIISIGAGTSSNYQRGIDNAGTFTMNGGTIKSDKNYTRMIFNDNGRVYVNNGTITASSSWGQGIFNERDGYVEINNGNITSGHYTICNTSTANSNGTIQINGGNITCTSNSTDNGVSYPKVIYNGSIGTINIAGGTLNKNFRAIWQGGDGTINITGGTINGLGDVVNNKSNSGTISITGGAITGNSYLVRNESSKGEVVIENVDLISKQNYNSVASGNSSSTTIINNSNVKGIENGNNSNLLIKGKSIITAKDANSNAISNGSGSIIIGEKIDEGVEEKPQTEPLIQGGKYGIYKNSVSGKIYFYDGTIKGTTNAVYGSVNEIEDKAEILINKSDGYEVATLTTDIQPVAQIGENTYKTLNEAINAVEGTEKTTITILRDFEIIAPQTSSTIEEGKNIVIDLNGNSITSTLENTIINNGNLKITDSNTEKQGTITLNLIGSNAYVSGIVNETTGKIDIDNNITIIGKGIYSNSINNKGEITTNNISLNGQGSYSPSYGLRLIFNTGILNLNNSKLLHIYTQQTYGIYNETGTVNINNIITGTGENIHTYEGEVNITGTVTREGGGVLVYLDQKSGTSEGTKLNITNATIIDTYSGVTSNLLSGRNGDIKINDSNITVKNNVINTESWNAIGIDITIENSTLANNGNITIKQGKGNLEIKDSDIIYNGTSTTYGAIQFEATGELKITGESSITSTGEKSIFGTSTGTITIGEKIGEGKIEEPQTTPIIKGTKYGIYQNNTNGKLYFYDGTVVGSNSYQAIYGKVTDTEVGYDVIIKENTEEKTLIATLEKLPVAQIGESKYYSLYEAVQAIEGTEETTITLLRDFNITTTGQSTQIGEGKNVIIDLNGKSITTVLENTIVNKGNLKIVDSNTENQGAITIDLAGNKEYVSGIVNESTGKIEISGAITITGKGLYSNTINNKGEITATNTKLISNGTYTDSQIGIRLISNTGILNLNSTTITHISGRFTYGIYNETGIVNINGLTTQERGRTIDTYEGEVNITGTVTREGIGTLIYLAQKSSASEGTKLDIENATIVDNQTTSQMMYGDKGKIKIYNSNIKAKTSVLGIGTNGVGVDITIEKSKITSSNNTVISQYKGNTEIKDSNIVYDGTSILYSPIQFRSTGNLTITGESNITSTGEKAIELTSTGNISIKGKVNVEGVKYGIYNSSTGTITLGENDSEVDRTYPCITGGEYGIYQSNSGGKLNFYDGQVKGKTGTIYGTITEIASGYEISKTNGDYYTDILVKSGVEVSVAKIGEVTYTSIQDAIAACPEGTQKTITIENNVIATSTITIPEGKDIILDLNGFTIIGENVDNVIENNGTLTILDGLNRGGKIENTSGTAIGGNGTLTVDSSATIVNGN